MLQLYGLVLFFMTCAGYMLVAFEQGCLNYVQCSHKLDTHYIKCI